MDALQTGLLVALFVAISLVIVLVINRRNSETGKRKHVTNTLKKFAGIRSYKVLHDITLENGKRTVHVDDILVGFFGLLLVNVQTGEGDYYGEERDQNWGMTTGTQKLSFPNPLEEGLLAMEALRTVFAKNKVYNINVEQVVVFTSRFKKNSLYIKQSLPVVNVRKLSAMLGKSRFEKDTGVDVAQLVSLIEQGKK